MLRSGPIDITELTIRHRKAVHSIKQAVAAFLARKLTPDRLFAQATLAALNINQDIKTINPEGHETRVNHIYACIETIKKEKRDPDELVELVDNYKNAHARFYVKAKANAKASSEEKSPSPSRTLTISPKAQTAKEGPYSSPRKLLKKKQPFYASMFVYPIAEASEAEEEAEQSLGSDSDVSHRSDIAVSNEKSSPSNSN